VSFNQALTFIKSVSADDGVTLIALDQPTVLPNSTRMRRVDRVAASLAGPSAVFSKKADHSRA
jgi:predicted RNase H-like nuclease